MTTYPIHTIDSAPEASRPVLRELNDAFGLIPNIAGAMAESPVLINAFIGVFDKVHSGSFSELQIQTLLLTNAVTNHCSWAAAFHTMLSLKAGMDPADVGAIRQRRLPKDAKLAALSSLARTMIENRGQVTDRQRADFVAAGFTDALALEAITVVAASTMTNYVCGLAHPPLDPFLEEHAWNG